MKVVAIVDKQGTALDRLAKGVSKHYLNMEYIVLDVHPKRPSVEQIERVKEHQDADIVDFQYFKSAEKLLEWGYFANSKKILTHNNPYSVKESNWNNYDYVVGNNDSIYNDLKNITKAQLTYIPLTVDTDFWTYNHDWSPEKRVLMVANRIEGKKGILPVAVACAEAGLKFVLVGNVSSPPYMDSIMATGDVEFHENVSDEELRDLYYGSGLHVCNSIDNFESGTLPILESMLCGTPVLTRNIGHVPELYNKENMIVSDHDPEDVITITKLIKDAFTRDLNKMRDKAWNTAKNRSNERRAYQYARLYRELRSQPPVTVVMPVASGNFENLMALEDQEYNNLEIIVVNDSPEVDLPKFKSKHWIRGINAPTPYYGLARARNIGVQEATGDIIVFCDQRMRMEKNAVSEFVKHIKPKHWLYGNKGVKKEFVENFSCVFRQEFINAGMFDERINMYGGMSQEIRSRIRSQGFTTEFIETAKATPIGKSSNRNRRRGEIITMKNLLYKRGQA